MTMKIAITKDGFNVLTEADAKNFVFDSTLNHLKTVSSGSFQKTVAAGFSATQTISHNLGYRPLVLAYMNDTSKSKWLVTMSQDPGATANRISTDDKYNVSFFVDTSDVVFKVSVGAVGPLTIEVQYEIFYEGDA